MKTLLVITVLALAACALIFLDGNAKLFGFLGIVALVIKFQNDDKSEKL